ncbi:hypothetical protein CPT_Moabite_327 [Serratia phage Moabite]|uniref:Uncharacterized protein n=2 Tax=Moabitevirus moabite TaxID=2846181 RepID=A0A7T3TM16_9CAUD|nr:hypothetical protein HWC48_gp089 [Serratia phage Moabite]QDB71357.1 hypothetical protein CPT_Moabite_327 [Serratia phage Moabite]QPX76827.1 hypothetical protein [Serratia phage vB_SmaM_Yaphecito]UQT03715.1 hypothetical protein KODAMA_02480 [Serratia phage vB_SmaM-Kodama]
MNLNAIASCLKQNKNTPVDSPYLYMHVLPEPETKLFFQPTLFRSVRELAILMWMDSLPNGGKPKYPVEISCNSMFYPKVPLVSKPIKFDDLSEAWAFQIFGKL